jgi:3-hydroxyacyl-[acyl-carrier-protein] dehydratase
MKTPFSSRRSPPGEAGMGGCPRRDWLARGILAANIRRMNADMNGALAALPHGPAFRFVDDLLFLEPGSHARARYHVRGDEAFLEGHFPGNPLMPGVILVEAIAQLGGIVAQTDRQVAALADLRLAAIRGAKILGAAVPGDMLELEACVEGRLGGLIQVSGSVTGPNGLLASAKITLSGTPAEQP